MENSNKTKKIGIIGIIVIIVVIIVICACTTSKNEVQENNSIANEQEINTQIKDEPQDINDEIPIEVVETPNQPQ